METGVLAKQAAGSVVVRCGDTMVLVTACAEKTPKNDKVDFVPLMVEYKEKAYAAGRIPGGFFKREARPGEHEILISRMIDRSIRPQFPKTHKRETQVIATVISYDGVNSPDILAMLGASAALHISELPFLNPIAAVRVGYIAGNIVINPNNEEKELSELDILVAGTADGIAMVEAGASELDESIVIDALMAGHVEIKKLIQAQERLQRFAEALRGHGVMRAVRLLLFEEGAAAAKVDRQTLANYLHLAEMLERVQQRRALGPELLYETFRRVRAGLEKSDEELQLRAATDEDAIKVMTVHKAKGLQFGVVFVPTLWSSGDKSRQQCALVRLRDEDWGTDGRVGGAYRALVLRRKELEDCVNRAGAM